MDHREPNIRPVRTLPDWVPDAVRLYLSHTSGGQSLRALARERGCHASTVLRQVRRFENRRDDPLIDEALNRLGRVPTSHGCRSTPDKDPTMTAPVRSSATMIDTTAIARDAPPILRSLCQPGAILAIAPDMDKAVVLCEQPDGRARRIAVLDRHLAEAMALQDWIDCVRPGRVASYAISTRGRAALRRFLGVEGEADAGGRGRASDDGDECDNTRRLRYGPAEGPVAVLARRRDRDGTPFLSPELVAAAERLREDFELAQMDPRFSQNWDRVLAEEGDAGGRNPAVVVTGAARARVADALRELGPGLGDMALRCCCYQEGLETAERRLGWSARSGKIVLRIALQRLRRHYDTLGRDHDLIG